MAGGSADRVSKAAKLLVDARLALERFSPLPQDCVPRTIEEAYELQDAFQSLNVAVHGDIVGYKVALTTKVMQELVGYHQPIPGGIFADTVHGSPGAIRCDGYAHLGIECELAVRLGDDLTPEAAPFDRSDVVSAVDEVMAAFEIVDDRHVDYTDFASNILTFIGDNAWNAGIVLGEPSADWRALDLAAAQGSLRVNGEVAAQGRGADVMGHPMDALAWLANTQASRGKVLRSGMVVMTGSIIATRFVNAGDELCFSMDGFSDVRLRIE